MWTKSCILNIYQAGNKSKPTFFLEFSDYELKRFLYTGRAALRYKGVRFADVLTSKQMETLETLKAAGKSGYFAKGQLHIRKTVQNRNFVFARRRNETHTCMYVRH